MQITHEHRSLYDTTKKFIEEQINPHASEWERAGIFPAREVFRKRGYRGRRGISKPQAVGELGLDYS